MSPLKPFPGLVLRYAYLWHAEAQKGQVEGTKDRPCAVILATEERDGETVVTVAPITHSPPKNPAQAIEIPAVTKERLELDWARSWVVTTEVNRFIWPGPDLRTVPNTDPPRVAYGVLPPRLFDRIRTQLVENARGKVAKSVRRTSH